MDLWWQWPFGLLPGANRVRGNMNHGSLYSISSILTSPNPISPGPFEGFFHIDSKICVNPGENCRFYKTVSILKVLLLYKIRYRVGLWGEGRKIFVKSKFSPQKTILRGIYGGSG